MLCGFSVLMESNGAFYSWCSQNKKNKGPEMDWALHTRLATSYQVLKGRLYDMSSDHIERQSVYTCSEWPHSKVGWTVCVFYIFAVSMYWLVHFDSLSLKAFIVLTWPGQSLQTAGVAVRLFWKVAQTVGNSLPQFCHQRVGFRCYIIIMIWQALHWSILKP